MGLPLQRDGELLTKNRREELRPSLDGYSNSSTDHGGGKAEALTKNAKFRDRPADDNRTNEPKEKYADPSASNHVASTGAVDRTNEHTEKYGEPSASNHVVSNDAEYSTDYSRDL
jgi:hypothetical protein